MTYPTVSSALTTSILFPLAKIRFAQIVGAEPHRSVTGISHSARAWAVVQSRGGFALAPIPPNNSIAAPDCRHPCILWHLIGRDPREKPLRLPMLSAYPIELAVRRLPYSDRSACALPESRTQYRRAAAAIIRLDARNRLQSLPTDLRHGFAGLVMRGPRPFCRDRLVQGLRADRVRGRSRRREH